MAGGGGDGERRGGDGSGERERAGERLRRWGDGVDPRARDAGRRALKRLAEPAPSSPAMRRTLGSPAIFAVVFSSVAAGLYFSLGVVADHALAVTPVVFLIAALFAVLCAMTYVEGASLHQERGGSTVFARYAFNELWSFVTGWALLLDYVILIAVCALAASQYLVPFWGELGSSPYEFAFCALVIVYVTARNLRGLSAGRLSRLSVLAVVNLVLLLAVIVIGLFTVLDIDALTDPVGLGSEPSWTDVLFALTLATVAFIGLESASGLAGEVRVSRRGLKRLVAAFAGSVLVLYVGMSVVALSALPQVGDETALSRNFLEMPVLGVVASYEPQWLADTLKYAVAGAATLLLVAAANGAMLGLSRLAYSLATNRQIPSAVGRLHPRYSTPWVAIVAAGVLAAALAMPTDLDFLVGIYAFGAMIAFTLAHLSVCVLRYREPDRMRPYKVPFSVRIGGGELPIPSAVGALASAAGWIAVLVLHDWARVVGGLWLIAGLALYVIYRRAEDKPVFKRVTVPAAALQTEAPEAEYGSILVPIFGRPLDDDIVQTAGRLAADEGDEEDGEEGATIEALWVFEIPMSLPLDASLPQERLEEARAALRRAKAVGEEYAGVQVSTATVRARRAGEAIIQEARRRGVEAIVLAAEEPSRVRGGALLGGRGGPRDNFVGEATKYVVLKAPCRVILTAPPAEDAVPPPPEPAAPVGDGSLSAVPAEVRRREAES
jgi:APA family basic amino acid/polyamine antiporter